MGAPGRGIAGEGYDAPGSLHRRNLPEKKVNFSLPIGELLLWQVCAPHAIIGNKQMRRASLRASIEQAEAKG
jgi:hypothetical protein